jgi:hypothetical protein
MHFLSVGGEVALEEAEEEEEEE